METTGRICTKCNTFKPWSEFYENLHGKNGRQSRCITCFAKRKRCREDKLFSKYGLFQDDYDRLYKTQNGVCKICGSSGSLVVDHCHRTGRVRGLLCSTCNRALGMLRDDVLILRAAIAYLET